MDDDDDEDVVMNDVLHDMKTHLHYQDHDLMMEVCLMAMLANDNLDPFLIIVPM